jgi:hypothetical protein
MPPSIKPWQLKRIQTELTDHAYTFDGDETIEFRYADKYEVKMSDLNRYPFFPPQTIIDGIAMSYASLAFPRRLYAEYFLKHDNKCPCCMSIACENNWSPSLGIMDILKEYFGFVETLKTYQKIKIFRDVNLPDDMINEIISFL